MGSINSRRKGIAGELELAAYLRDHGWEATRGQQFRGSPESPDVVTNLPGVHSEVKRAERIEILKWCRQAEADAGDGMVPVVWFRPNHQPWRVTLPGTDFLRILAASRA